jgi:hypothetical protein
VRVIPTRRVAALAVAALVVCSPSGERLIAQESYLRSADPLSANRADRNGASEDSRPIVWQGPLDRATIDDLAGRVAPILWFSADEPLAVGMASLPEQLPCDLSDDPPGAVVYYLASADPSALKIDPGKSQQLAITFYFYYHEDIGLGCHSNDFEHATFHLEVRSTAPVAAATPQAVIRLDEVEGAAHGSAIYANWLELSKASDTSLPLVLLVEEGKHSVCPDRNGDGVYTPGYDTNVLVNEAWGIRDVLGSGFGAGRRYEASMTKPRFQEDRVAPPSDDPAVWSRYRSRFGRPSRRYALRPIPVACRRGAETTWKKEPDPLPGCQRRTLSSLLQEAGVRHRTRWNATKNWFEQTFAGGGLRIDNHAYSLDAIIPIYEEPVYGGIVFEQIANRIVEPSLQTGHHTYFPGADFGIFYTPSLATFMNPYLGVGWSTDRAKNSFYEGFDVEGGLRFRVQRVYVGVAAVRRQAQWSTLVELGFGVGVGAK